MITQAQGKAAGEMVDLIANRIGTGRAVHPQTAVASAARLAGSILLRSFDIIPAGTRPGTAILSNEANEEGPKLLGVISGMLKQLGETLNQGKLAGAPSPQVDPPVLSVLESLELLQADALRIAQANGLSLKEAAWSAAMATGFIVKECARDIGPEEGFTIAASGIIEGCKTVPPEFGAAPAPSAGKKPWYKLW